MSVQEKKSRSPRAARLQAHIGTLDEMGGRFVDAWHRAEQGDEVSESHVTFLDLDSLLKTLSTRRLELLRHVRKHGGYPNIKALADALQRDYKNVHDDVTTLVGSGLLVQDGRRISVPWSEVLTSVAL